MSIDLKAVCVRNYALDIERGRVEAKEAKALALQKQVAEVNLKQITELLEHDVAVLKSTLPADDEQSKEHQLDVKYLRDRQMYLGLKIEHEVLYHMFRFLHGFVAGNKFLFLCADLFRSRKGRDYAQKYLEENCKLIAFPDEDFGSHGLASFLQFLEPMRGVAGTVPLVK